MSAHRHDITPTVRMQLASTLISSPKTSRLRLAQRHKLSRPSLYSIEKKGLRALEQCFDPSPLPSSPSSEGFYLWVDKNVIKRAVVTLRAVLGAPFSAIVTVLAEMFLVRLSEWSVREIVEEGYQRGFNYQQSVPLHGVKRVAFDEMYRWGRCIFSGIDCDSLFILLGEKQPGCKEKNWAKVMGRLKTKQGLKPEQVAIDGLSALGNAVKETWKDARLVHDIAHANIMLRKVRGQFDQRAYRAIEAAEKIKQRHERGETRKTTQEELKTKLSEAEASEQAAIEKATHVAELVEQAHAALAVINPDTGCLNQAPWSQGKLLVISEQLKALGTWQATETASYLARPAQKMVLERAEFGRVMHSIALRKQIPFALLEVAAWLWQLHKQHEAATWAGTREKLQKQMQKLWLDLNNVLGLGPAQSLLEEIFRKFREILAASSPVEWGNNQLSVVLPAQKRASSGMLHLRAAYLNLHQFADGRRKGVSPHQMLTGEQVPDWLVKLGYAPHQTKVRSFKKLGWRRLVEPFEPTWRRNWLDNGFNEALSAADEFAFA